MKIARRLAEVAPSATLALAQRAREMAAAGQSVVSLTAGEPDFTTPAHITDALKRSVDEGHTRYTAVGGTPQLREAIRARYAARGFHFPLDQIVASTGAKQCLFNAILATVDPGDEVIFAAPYWLSYRDMVNVAGGVPKIVETREADGFVMRPEPLAAALSERTRAVILNTPANPTGAVYDRDDLRALGDVLKDRGDVLVIADEIYEHIVYEGAEFVCVAEVAPGLFDRTLLVNGCSKTYAMTGLRLGWAAGPKPLIKAMTTLQGQSTSNPTAPVQDAAIAAITGDHDPVHRMVDAFARRRRIVVNGLRALPGVTCFEPRGAFYAFPNFGAYVGKKTPAGETIESATGVCQHLLDAVQVVVVPGGPFGAPNHLRVSFATDDAVLEDGLRRMATGLAQLKDA